jgi:hypothetical protein
MDKMAKIKDRAYGANYIKQIDAETEALKRELLAQKALAEEAEHYISVNGAQVIADLTNNGKIGDQ